MDGPRSAYDPMDDKKILDWLEKEHPEISSSFEQWDGNYATWTIAPAWRKKHTRRTLREAVTAAMRGA